MSGRIGDVTPVSLEPLGALVARHLRRAILSGRLSPGTRLVESVLAEDLQVSRGPVREALVQLEAEGLVKIYPRRGAVVSELDLGLAWEVYTLRGHLEVLALGVLRHRPEALDVAALEAVIDRMVEAGREGGDPLEWVDLDLEFHGRLCAMSGLQRLKQMHEGLDSLVGALFLLSGRLLRRRPEDLPRIHRPIVDALKDRDFDRATRLVGEHYFRPARAALAERQGSSEPILEPWDLYPRDPGPPGG